MQETHPHLVKSMPICRGRERCHLWRRVIGQTTLHCGNVLHMNFTLLFFHFSNDGRLVNTFTQKLKGHETIVLFSSGYNVVGTNCTHHFPLPSWATHSIISMLDIIFVCWISIKCCVSLRVQWYQASSLKWCLMEVFTLWTGKHLNRLLCWLSRIKSVDKPGICL